LRKLPRVGRKFAEISNLFATNMKSVLPKADFVIEGYFEPREPLRDETSRRRFQTPMAATDSDG